MNKLVKQGLVWLGAATIAVSLIACDSLFPPQGDLSKLALNNQYM
jgi:hypothetical protein